MAKSFMAGFNSVFTRGKMMVVGIVWTLTGLAAMFIPALGARVLGGLLVISGLGISLACHFKVGKGLLYSK
jgi:hypothetical protein